MKNKFLVHNNEVRQEMLKEIGLSCTEDLFKSLDAGIRLREELDLPEGLNEVETRQRLVSLAKKNQTTSNNAYFIGGGCYNKFSPWTKFGTRRSVIYNTHKANKFYEV